MNIEFSDLYATLYFRLIKEDIHIDATLDVSILNMDLVLNHNYF